MAGDWIKIEKATLAKPEVLAIAELLGIHPLHAFGLCAKFWMWCDDQLKDGNARGVTKVTLDFVIGHDGMADALVNVGWLRDRSGSLEVPHFDRHLSEGAKNRALTKERVRKSKGKSNAASVTRVTPLALPEKRREEKSTPNGTQSHGECAKRFAKPTVDEVDAYGKTLDPPFDRALQFCSHYESNGWRVGRNPMKDWRAAVRTWVQKDSEFGHNGHNGQKRPVDTGPRTPDITEV